MQSWLKCLSIPPLLLGLTAGSAVLLWLASSLRHWLFQSAGWDLGIFDQGLYLLSQGLPPYSTLREIHLLGDHAAWILYPIALLYKLYPSVYWLLAIQALALALGAIPTFALARQADLPSPQALTLALVYLLYPLVFNVNLCDFHPEVLAVPLLLTAVWAARSHRISAGDPRYVALFILCLLLTLGCKEVLGLTVTAMGIWLLVWERQRVCGLWAIAAGMFWFAIATQVIIPALSGLQPAGVSLYGYLGDSIPAVIANIFLKPQRVLGQLLSLGTLEYLALLLGPVLWGLSIPALVPLFPALPTLALNLLSSEPQQRNLTQHYSLPILPFLILAVITTLQGHHHRAEWSWRRRSPLILGWAIAAFLLLAKYGYFGSLYLRSLDTWHASRTAIAQVKTADPVLTTSNLAPHLTHRRLIRQTQATSPPADLGEFYYGVLNVKQPGWLSTPEFAQALVAQFQADDRFTQVYAEDGVYVFQKISKDNRSLGHDWSIPGG